MSMIDVSGLSFGYEGSPEIIFDNVSFRIDTDWKLGFTGRNGRGKTTFLNLLMGRYEYCGSITSSIGFEYFPYVVEDKTKDTIEIVSGIYPSFELWRLEREMNLLGLSGDVLYRPFHTLSHGERTKVLLAVLFIKPNSFLLIDEPTDHLDTEARQNVSRYLNGKKGFILVSHDRNFLDGCVDHILSINRTNIEIQKGNFSSWYSNKEMHDAYEEEKNRNLKKDIRRLTDSAKQTEKWSGDIEKSKIGTSVYDRGYVGHMAAKMMKRSKNIVSRREKAIEEKNSLLKNIEIADRLTVKPLEYHKHRLIEAIELEVRYGRRVFSGLSFSIETGERVSIRGGNGCGKTSLIKMILGEKLDYRGELRIGSGLKISYVSQDMSFLKGGLKDYARKSSIDETLFKAILRKLDFPRELFEKDMSLYSEGQKKKTLIARSLCEQAHLYIWDEPLNYIDVISRMQIEKLIINCHPAMPLLFVEHDEAFASNVATKYIDM